MHNVTDDEVDKDTCSTVCLLSYITDDTLPNANQTNFKMNCT